MKAFLFFITIIYLIAPALSYCEDLTIAKKEAIKELMQISGEAQFVEIIGNNFIRKFNQSLKNTNQDIDPNVFDIVTEECKTVIHEEYKIKESYQPYFYPIYHKHLSFKEIKELINFYKTPLGRKLVAITPILATESINAEKSWAQQILGPKLNKRVSSRLEKEGIEIGN